ncbi:MAG: hypothetical protein WBA45_17925 [Microthrixaceae bacterium]
MSAFESALARYVAAHRTAGATAFPGPADEADISDLVTAVAPLIVPEQMITLWRHASEGPAWLVDAGDLLSPRSVLEAWIYLQSVDSPPFPSTLLPIAFASFTYLTMEHGCPGVTFGGALLRVPFEGIEPVAPDMSTALDLAAGAIEDGRAYWTGTWWGGVDFEALQRQDASAHSWPPHFANIGTVQAIRPLSWPTAWQRASGIDPADAEPRGADATIADLQLALAGSVFRVTGRVVGLVGSATGSLLKLEDGSSEVRCWCPSSADPYFVAVKGQLIEIEVLVQDAIAAEETDSDWTLDNPSNYRFVAARVRLGSSVDF